jgi:AcrR family transcriptional regulator
MGNGRKGRTMRKQQLVPVATAQRSTGGRPRKYSEEQLVDAALRVMERQGYAGLTIRSLAQELGTSHPTLYNYVAAIEEIQVKALLKLTARLPQPTATTALALRTELITYLLAASRLLLQHPGLMFPPIGSAAWKPLKEVSDRWIASLLPYTPDLKTAQLAFGALGAPVFVGAERERVYGPDLEQQVRSSKAKHTPAFETLEQRLDAMTDFVLPALTPGKKTTPAASRGSRK